MLPSDIAVAHIAMAQCIQVYTSMLPCDVAAAQCIQTCALMLPSDIAMAHIAVAQCIQVFGTHVS
eukprot:1160339-Pelagomonas_calceolata.AAC.2